MKERLKLWYGDIQRSIKVTMIATIVILTLNFLVNSLNNFKSSLWIFYIVPVKNMSPYLLTFKFFVTFLNSVTEAFLICYTAENIDFRYYILVLCEGRRRLKFAPHISIFIHLRPYIDCSMDDSDSNDDYNSHSSIPTTSLMEDIKNNTDNFEDMSSENPYRGKTFSKKGVSHSRLLSTFNDEEEKGISKNSHRDFSCENIIL